MALQGNRLAQSCLSGNCQCFHNLPAGKIGTTNIAYFSLTYNYFKAGHISSQRSVEVKSMGCKRSM